MWIGISNKMQIVILYFKETYDRTHFLLGPNPIKVRRILFW